VNNIPQNLKGCTRPAAASDKVYQLLAHGRWFSPASSTTKTGRHDVAERLLKVTFNTINKIIIKIQFKTQRADVLWLCVRFNFLDLIGYYST
jgi:hypothetical protein